MKNRMSIKTTAAIGAIAALALRLAPAHAAEPAQPATSELAPQVVHTGTGPTGYSVIFRFYDPTATSIRIKGEWSFASAADIAANPTIP